MQINKQKYTLSQITDIIDNHLGSNNNLMFICNFSVAHSIYDYIHNDYGIEAECMELSSDVDEYYVSLQFYKNEEIGFFCEFAKMDDGTYKYDEVDNIDYYVMSDMSFGDVREFLAGKGRVIFCEFDDESNVNDVELEEANESYLCKCCSCDNDDCDEYNCTCGKPDYCEDNEIEIEEDHIDNDLVIQCDCPDCVDQRRIDALEYEDEQEFCTCDYCTEEREQNVISEFLDMLFDPEGACRECIIEKFIDSLYTFKNFGIKETKENMREWLED